MLPAFRVKGLWPKQINPGNAESNHPVTGASLSHPKESVLQLPKNRYDEFIVGHPEYRLKYLDEDKEIITIGSELELVQRLQEPAQPRLVMSNHTFKTDPRFYTAISEHLHGFEIDDNEESRKLWNFIQRATISRNDAAYKLWMRRGEVDANVQALLDQHAREFVEGYDFEGFNSHYNFLSQTGQRIKEIATSLKPTLPSGVSEASQTERVAVSTDPRVPDSIGRAYAQQIVVPAQATSNIPQLAAPGSAPALALSPMDRKVRLDDISAQLNKQLEEARRRTDELEQRVKSQEDIRTVNVPSPSTHASSVVNRVDPSSYLRPRSSDSITMAADLNRQLEDQIKQAKATGKVFGESNSKEPKAAHHSDGLDTGLLIRRLSGQPSETRGNGTPGPSEAMKSTRKALLSTDPKNTSTIASKAVAVQPQHLTDVGRSASEEAGIKLRYQLYGGPRPFAGASQEDLLRYMVKSRDPPAQQSREYQPSKHIVQVPALPKTNPSENTSPQPKAYVEAKASTSVLQSPQALHKKKSVRFSDPQSVYGHWNLDGSYSPGRQSSMPIDTTPPRTMTAGQTQGPFVMQTVTAVANPSTTQFPSTSTSSVHVPLSSEEVFKLREMIRDFDGKKHVGANPGSSTKDKSSEDRNMTSQATNTVQRPSLKLEIATSVQTESTDAGNSQEPRQRDSAEILAAKLWFQTMENITANLETFAGQLEAIVVPQINREEQQMNASLRQPKANMLYEHHPEFLDHIRHVRDLITLRGDMLSTSSKIKQWSVATNQLLENPKMFKDQAIYVNSIRATSDRLRDFDVEFGDNFYSALIESMTSEGQPNNDYMVPRRYADIKNNRSSKQPAEMPGKHVAELSSKIKLPATEQKVMKPVNSQVEGNASTPPKSLRTARSAPSLKATTKMPETSNSDAKLLERFPPLVPSRASLQYTPSAVQNKAGGSKTTEEAIKTAKPAPQRPASLHLPAFHPIDLKSALVNPHTGSTSSKPSLTLPMENPFPWNQVQVTANAIVNKANPELAKNTDLTAVNTWKNLHAESTARAATFDWNKLQTAPGNRTSMGQSLQRQDQPVMPQDPIFDFEMCTPPDRRPTSSAIRPSVSVDGLRQRHSWNPVVTSSTASVGSTSHQNPYAPRQRPHSTIGGTGLTSTRSQQPLQEIPDHRNPRNAAKIMQCVASLRALGYGSPDAGGHERLIIYAEAAKGVLEDAIDIIEEEHTVYKEKEEEIDALYN